MDACQAVEKEIDKVTQKFSSINSHSQKVIDDITLFVQQLQASIAEAPQDAELTPGQVVLLKDALSKTKEKLQRVTTDHRDLHGTVSKVGKAIERSFISDFTATSRQDLCSSEHNVKLLDNIIAQHFHRQGMDDVASSLVKESGLTQDEITPDPYASLHRIWEAILNRDLSPALKWATDHSVELQEKHSSLEFKLHRLAFMQILTGGVEAQTDAIYYARTNFSKFVCRHEKEIQTLMGTLIYLPMGIENSPYKHLMAAEMWVETADTFLKDACSLLGIIKDSPLTVIVNTGSIALPALLSLKQVMQSRQVTSIWSGRDELPIEIDLEPEHRYHSIFACPILRQQSTDENPPMRLICGHVISRDALNKLSNGSGINNTYRLKCPYCPQEQNPNDAKLIYF